MRTLAAILAVAAAATAHPMWKKVARAPADEVVNFRVALPMSNMDKLDAMFHAVSTPGSPMYGRYMSKQQINEMTATPRYVAHDVLMWLNAGKADCKLYYDSIACRAAVGDIERMLQTEMSTFQHSRTGDRVHRIDSTYAFPTEMMGKVEFVSGLYGFPVEHLGRVRKVQAGDAYITPETLTAMYQLQNAAGNATVKQAPAEFQDYPAFGNDDLNTFITQTAVPKFKVVKTVGPFDQSNPQPESTLDIQYLGATGVGNSNWYWTESDWMYEFTQNVLAAGEAGTPDIFSMSYGWSEQDQCQISPSVPPCENGGSLVFVARVNAEFQKIGVNGITLLASSGDSGAHGRTDPTCQDAKTRPDYPAASPFLTAVGATQIDTTTSKIGGTTPFCKANQCVIGGTEIVASPKTGALIASGGGFSVLATRPSYQETVVSKYLTVAGATPPAGDFNKTNRGYPDVAALGHYYYIQLTGEAVAVDGTSCSSPVFAGIVGLLNAERARKNLPKIGFANPLLYQIYAQDATAFTDITSGDNYCTESSCDCTDGYKAAPGWDATTGLGTPVFPKLVAAMSAIDARSF